MPDAPPDMLRDTLFIWIYVTTTRFDDVKSGATDAPQLLKTLEQGKHIKVGDSQNQQTVQEAVLAVGRFPAELGKVNAALKSLSALSSPWSGGGQHPKLSELDPIYIAPRS